MFTLAKLLVCAYLVVATHLIEASIIKSNPKEKDSNVTCVIKHNSDKQLLQVGAVDSGNPPQGYILFTEFPSPTNNWEVIPVENSKDFFRLRNIVHNQYLTVQEPWCTSYDEGVGNFEDFVWRLEETGNGWDYLIHNKTNLCMSQYVIDLDPEVPKFYVPVMNQNCTKSRFAIECSV